MRKLVFSGLAGGFVLMSGLVSCSPERKKQDVYQTTPPVIQGPGGEQDLKSWNAQKQKHFDLQDIINFSRSAPAQVNVQVQCRSGEENHNGEFSLSGRQQTEIWQILPEEVLTVDYAVNPVQCDFVLTLINAAGSKHIYTLTSVPIGEERPASAHLGRESRDSRDPRESQSSHDSHDPHGSREGSEPLSFSVFGARDIRLHYANNQPAQARIFCSEVKIKALPFDRVLDLSRFDFTALEGRSGLGQESLSTARPVQTCRALIEQNGQKVALTSHFQIVFPPPPLQVQLAQLPLREDGNENSLGDARSPAGLDPHEVLRAQPLLLNEWRLHNSEKLKRLLRLSKAAKYAVVDVYFAGRPRGVVHRQTYTLPGLSYIPEGRLQLLKETDEAWFLQLEPQTDLYVRAVFRSNMVNTCASREVSGLVFSRMQVGEIDEILESGETTQVIQLQPVDWKMIFAKIPDINMAADAYRCDWH